MNQPVIIDYKNYLSNKEKKDLEKIFRDNFEKIIKTLKLNDDYPEIKYYLYPSEEIKIQETGEDGYAETDPANFKVFMVYNKDIQPTGPHELVHILTNKLGTPNFVFNEGIAEYFEEYWKGEVNGKKIKMSHDEWVRKFVKDGIYVSINTLFDDFRFWDADETAMISYPESGSFFRYLVKEFGLEKVLEVFKCLKRRPNPSSYNHDMFKNKFSKSVSEIEREWLDSLN